MDSCRHMLITFLKLWQMVVPECEFCWLIMTLTIQQLICYTHLRYWDCTKRYILTLCRNYFLSYQFEEASTLFLCASDFEVAKQYGFKSAEFEEAKNRLIKFYSKLGFRVIKDNIMVYHKTEDWCWHLLRSDSKISKVKPTMIKSVKIVAQISKMCLKPLKTLCFRGGIY